MKKALPRVPVSGFYLSAMSVRCLDLFASACNTLNIEYLDQITEQNIPDIRAAFAKTNGVGKVYLGQFDKSFLDWGLLLAKATDLYLDSDNPRPSHSRLIKRVQAYLDGDLPVPKEDIHLLLDALKQKRNC